MMIKKEGQPGTVDSGTVNAYNLNSINDSDANILIQNVAKQYKPVFEKGNYSLSEKRAIYRYFFSAKPVKLPPSLKGRIINLYDPLADRTQNFPDGLRFCINVYVGCEHGCSYCYVNGYSKQTVSHLPHAKEGFKKGLLKDIDSIKSLGVPIAPLHMSNSTDICQENLETNYRHTLFTLESIAESRNLFSSIVLLTKNPKLLCEKDYLSLLNRPDMQPLTVQITCAYWNDNARKFFEPDAPAINSRIKALNFLCEHNVNVELRIDPLFPSSSIPEDIRKHKPLNFYSLPEAQPYDDLVKLIRFAKNSGVNTVISKPLKIPISNKAQEAKDMFGVLYKDANANGRRTAKGGSWRLPENYQKTMMKTVASICKQEGIKFKYCKHDVLTRK